MQSLSWYARRLRAMGPEEVVWRIRCAARDIADRCLLRLRKRRAMRQVVVEDQTPGAPGYAVTDVPVGAWWADGAGDLERAWLAHLVARADRIAAGRWTLFDLTDHDLGNPIDWNRDPKSGKATPLVFAPQIDYRDPRRVGDCKFIWELNRHHHLVVLGRAYRASGEVEYARAAVAHLEQWLEQCPYGTGVNWRSPLELAIRLINWVWTIDLIRPSGVITEALRRRLSNAVYLHLWEISRKYSKWSSANNHLIGEAAGVYIASCYFRGIKNSARWQAQSRKILCREILQQTFPDGATREQALGYQLFVVQFFLLAGLVARRLGDDFPSQYWERLEGMLGFIAALGEGGGTLPMIGDCDDGYVLDLDTDPQDIRPWLAIGAVVFGDPTLKAQAGNRFEAIEWLPGSASRTTFESIETPREERGLDSRAFADAGYYLLQCGARNSPGAISVVFDCGPLGYKSLAAHGHADALSFTLRAFGVDVMVDPGTFDYFSHPQWREYFRGTSAHNTATVDDLDQSVMLGPFLWGAKARARCLGWNPSEHGGRVSGEHDGYLRLESPVRHRRTLELDGRRRELLIVDQFLTPGQHEYGLCFHLAEQCQVAWRDGNLYEIDAGPGRITLEFDGQLAVEALVGSRSPIGGWVSRGYHSKVPSTTLVGRCLGQGAIALRTRMTVGNPASPVQQPRQPAARPLRLETRALGQLSHGD